MKTVLASVIVLASGIALPSLGHSAQDHQVIRHDRLTLTVKAGQAAQTQPANVVRVQRTDRIRVVKFDAAEAAQMRQKIVRNDRVVFRKAI